MTAGAARPEPPEPATDAEALELLRRGDLEVLGLLPRASNFTFLARVRSGSEQTLAVYKPRAGEAPLWDFPDGSLAEREVAAYVVSEALGWPHVPPTTIRDGPHGAGSVQRFVPFDPDEHYLTMRERRPEEFRRIALFDVVVNNADRKSGHCLLGAGGVFVVDHGVCFHEEPKLRTVIWDFMGESIPEPLVRDLRSLAPRVAPAEGDLRERLLKLLSPPEVTAVSDRLTALLDSGRFPEPGPGRPVPWPVV